jgi:hypothetical protein
MLSFYNKKIKIHEGVAGSVQRAASQHTDRFRSGLHKIARLMYGRCPSETPAVHADPFNDPKFMRCGCRSAFLFGKECFMNLVLFIFNSIMLGIGLAMDAFCVSMTNGLHEPEMSGRRSALFPAHMPVSSS